MGLTYTIVYVEWSNKEENCVFMISYDIKNKYKLYIKHLGMLVALFIFFFPFITHADASVDLTPEVATYDLKATNVDSISDIFLQIEENVANCTFVNSYIYPDRENNITDVRNLQAFLNTFEGETLNIGGIYNFETQKAVHRFQEKYNEDILSPWGLTESTGNVYITTKKKVNEVFCGKLLSYSDIEYNEMALYKAQMGKLDEVVYAPNINDKIESSQSTSDGDNVLIEEFLESIDFDLSTMFEDVVSLLPELEDYDTLGSQDGNTNEPADNNNIKDKDIIKDKLINKDNMSDRDSESGGAVVIGDNDSNDKMPSGIDSVAPVNSSGVLNLASSFVGFVDSNALSLLIILSVLLIVQLYFLWRAPSRPLY